MEGPDRIRVAPEIDRLDLILLSVLFVLAALLFLNAEGKLMHPLIDIGRDLYIPEQIAAGTELYTDISYYYPPLAPHLLSLPAALTQWNLSTVAAIGALVSLLAALVLYLFCRKFVNRVSAVMVVLLFVCLNFTGAYGFGSNFIFPYSHGAIFGLLFFLSGLFVLVRELYIHQPSQHWWIALVMFMAAGWCKLELAAFGTLMMLIAAGAYYLQGHQSAGYLIRRLLLSGIMAILVLAAVSMFFGEAERHWLSDQILAPTLFEGQEAKTFYSRVTGSFMWRLNLAAASQGTLLTLVYIFAVHLFDRLRRRTDTGLLHVLLVIPLLALMTGCAIFLSTDRFLFFRAWTLIQPLILVLVAGLMVRHIAYRTKPSVETLQLILVLAASIALTSRIYLHITPRWYGFWMTVPLYLLIVQVLFSTLPRCGIYSRRSSLLWIPLVVVICVNGVSDQIELLGQKIYPISTDRGTIFDHDPYRAVTFNQVLQYLDRSSIEELVVMPEGLTINYFSRIPNPIWYHTFSPMEIGDPNVEADVISELETSRPRWVLVSNLPYIDWGGEGFGRGYAIKLDRYLHETYRLEKEWRSPTTDFFLLERTGYSLPGAD